jgi:hypothetical protein
VKSPKKQHPGTPPKKHHIDRRAADIIATATGGDEDEMMTTRELADWFRNSRQWFEIARTYGYGPKFTRISTRMIRYRRGDVIDWLRERSHASTAEYARSKP